MKSFKEASDLTGVIDVLDHARNIHLCAFDSNGVVRYGDSTFREMAKRQWAWRGSGNPLTIDDLAVGDGVYHRERIATIRSVIEGGGKPQHCVDLILGCAYDLTYVRWTGNAESDALVICVFSEIAQLATARPESDARWFTRPTDPHTTGDLTRAEIETLRLVAMGYSTDEIAAYLNRTRKAIERRRMSIRRKLDVEGRLGMLEVAVRTGLAFLPLDELDRFTNGARARRRFLRRAHPSNDGHDPPDPVARVAALNGPVSAA